MDKRDKLEQSSRYDALENLAVIFMFGIRKIK